MAMNKEIGYLRYVFSSRWQTYTRPDSGYQLILVQGFNSRLSLVVVERYTIDLAELIEAFFDRIVYSHVHAEPWVKL